MSDSSGLSIEDIDIDFKNSITRLVALENLQKLTIADINVGPLEKGKEVEVTSWIAEELVKAGYARFQEGEMINIASLNKIHWRETRLQSGRTISPLPEFFYPKLRRFLEELRNDSMESDHKSAMRLIVDIINIRIKKILRLGASSSQTENILRHLTPEEKIFYNKLHSTVMEWKLKILRLETHE